MIEAAIFLLILEVRLWFISQFGQIDDERSYMAIGYI